MAEIDIQKKGGSPWPWIIGLLALLLLIWAAMEMLDNDDEAEIVTPTVGEQMDPPVPANGMDAGLPAEFTRFEQQCGSSGNAAAMSPDHSYIDGCVTQMTAAMAALVQRDTVNGAALEPKLQELRERAGRLTQNAQSLEHSTYVQQVFESAASLIESVENARTASGAASAGTAARVKQAASAVSASQPVLDQKEAVQMFFNETSAALRSMAAG